ncbi:sodium/calcium exchanger 3-like isoform X2 [Tubulanus polymorphus]|uniref:sodium/calcium exchanger 3-like isoform X2 n=1 Tax=Tubulanus polymorphus TaxID=672921 RepID=UPI003DA6144D
MSSNNGTCDVTTYKCSNVGLLLPFVNEYTWPVAGRAVIYLLGLLWCFLGISIIADVFMCAIEKITSKTKTVLIANLEVPGEHEEVEVKVWNDTVANLTLMALGSSAPEILLSIFEVCVTRGFKSGELGPGTIVGSAAFNLLVIIAVCIGAIPSPEVRRIKAIKVFYVTAFFSVFAYIWLIIILVLITPDYVDLWEGILTFLFFPMLVLIAFMCDKDYLGRKDRTVDDEEERGYHEHGVPLGGDDSPHIRQLLKDIGKGQYITEDDVAKLAATLKTEEESHSKMWYRINATRNITGAKKLTPVLNEVMQEVYDHLKEKKELGSDVSIDPLGSNIVDMTNNNMFTVVEFTATSCAVLENEGRVRIGIQRYGRMNNRVMVKVNTVNGTAEAGSDYIPVKETLVFEPNEKSKNLDIEIIDDDVWEPDEVFFVKLVVDENQNKGCVAGAKSICQVTILNDDEPGKIEIENPTYVFKESAGKALIPIRRSDGCDGKVSVQWKTEDVTAIAGRDYEAGEGTLTFEHGETNKNIEITLHDDQEAEKDEHFNLVLFEPTGGATLGRSKAAITIINDDDFNGLVGRLVSATNANMDRLRVDTQTWGEQFHNAMNVNGGDVENATHLDYLMHFLTFGWKIIFAIVPPASIWGGWLAFLFSLVMIGILTAIVGDLASIFGCLVDLKDSVTSITLVALGTSLPDLFASRQAAVMEKYADNSIGNVTGSNSVNVFLGLGISWMLAACYWTYNNQTFKVNAGSLVFSVIIYAVFACLCIVLILLRRFVPFFGGGELGGSLPLKITASVILVAFWLIYILVSSFQAYRPEQFALPF